MRTIVALLATFPVFAAEVEPLVVYRHTSDILRGSPFNERDEIQQDYIGFGVTISWRTVALDLTHGRRSIERQPWESGTDLSVRYYPFRRESRAIGRKLR